ncbi:MAG TPA: flavodoxin domain-containing protein [Fermentimonas sp.]|nr:flavodoxin domain-containing protein [Fermentimonas sp.]
MNNSLIIYASDHGTVEKCAKELFVQLDGKVDLCNLNVRNSNPDLSTYDTIIIGGSIHSGKIQNVIAQFCEENIDLLSTKNIGLFINCLYSGEKAQQQLDEAFPALLNSVAVARDYFGGEINDLKLSYWEKIITKQMIEQENLVVKLSKERIDKFAIKMAGAYEK